jgi:PKD repeat protein
MKYLTPMLILVMLCGLAGCSPGGISEPFRLDLNILPSDGEAPLAVSGSVQIEGGSSVSLSDYDFVWRIPAIPAFQSTSQVFNYVFDLPGIYRVDVTVTDKNTQQTVHTYTTVNVVPDIEELQVVLDFLYPDEDEDGKAPIGKAPFTVEMGAIVTGGEEPYFYEWDYNSDDINEAWGPEVESYKGTFASPGVYKITVKVTDARYTTAIDSRYVNVLPSTPVAVAHALPPEGPVGMFGLYVVFSADGSYDPDGKIVLYEWDFQGDGTFDWTSDVTGSTSYGFTEPGNYYPTLRVTDNDGLQGLATVQVVVTF